MQYFGQIFPRSRRSGAAAHTRHVDPGELGKNPSEGLTKISIEGVSEEFEWKLLALLADHRHELTVTADTK
ncbi:hypothetical protein ABT144_14665 [Streptomyces sp. NPDC002039]|uniref:hypothetical protein n=1 Tax=Streptomyces sp. NPDC002039 TaxID=3154660 RepID=UPI00332CB9F0